MRQQATTQSFTQDYVSTSRSSMGGSVGNNANMQQRMMMVNDMDAWLDMQLRVIMNLPTDAQADRINGIMYTVQGADQSFQRGMNLNMSHFPMAPTASDQPDLQGMSPELRSSLQRFNFRIAAQQHESNWVAGSFGMFNMGGPVDQGLLVASAGKTGVSSHLQNIGAKVNALKLKLPYEKGLFSVAQYGDYKSLMKILESCIANNIRSPDQVAYILATAWHESHMGDWMTEGAWLPKASAERDAERSYGPTGNNPQWAKSNGNTQAGDGARYMGRGFVQLTWKNNYRYMSTKLREAGYTYTHKGVTYGDGKNGTTAIDLVKNYTHVSDNKDLAAQILVMGMDKGLYVQDNKGLDSYIPEGQAATHGNFQNARKIVNGSDQKRLIADNAVVIAGVLKSGDAWVKAFSS